MKKAYMEWEEAIEKYAINKSLNTKTKNSIDVKNKIAYDIRFVLNQIPELKLKSIHEITPTVFWDIINNYRKEKRLQWDAIMDGQKGVYRGKYNDMVRCLVFARDNFTCKICGRSALTNPKIELHLDHKIPKGKRGDPFSLENLQCTCSCCNYIKQTRKDEEAIGEIKDIANSLKNKVLEEPE